MYTYSQHQFLSPVRVAGVNLRPLTLGHMDVLCGLESPVCGGDVNDPTDLAVALFVCSRDWKTAAAEIRSGRAGRMLHRMGRRFGRMSAEKAGAVYAAFADYIQTCSAAPPRWEEPGAGGGSPRAPWHLAAFCILQEKTNFQPLEAWDLTVSRAFELCAVIGANNGDDKLMTEAEMRIQEMLKDAPEPVFESAQTGVSAPPDNQQPTTED
jgi:hypothetical protein